VIRENAPSFSINYDTSHFFSPQNHRSENGSPAGATTRLSFILPRRWEQRPAEQARKDTQAPAIPLREPTREPGDLFVVCRFEIPVLNYSATSGEIVRFSLDSGPPVKWSFGTPDFDQEWLKRLWIGSGFEEAQNRAFALAVQWSGNDKYFWHRVNHGEYRMHSGIKKLENELKGKVYVDGPFVIEGK
jgi:hypothetical protein